LSFIGYTHWFENRDLEQIAQKRKEVEAMAAARWSSFVCGSGVGPAKAKTNFPHHLHLTHSHTHTPFINQNFTT
jgi:hypothetical protein